MKRKITLFMALLLAIMMMVGCSSPGNIAASPESSENENSDTSDTLPLSGRHLVIGTNAEFAPYESIDASGNFVGFDIDLIGAISDKLGFTYEWRDMEFFGLLGAVQENRVDLVISGLSGTEERAKRVDFSRGYSYSIMVIISKPGSGIEIVDDLAGKKVGATTGSNFEDLIRAIPGAELVSYDVTVPVVNIIGTPELDALIEVSSFAENYAAPLGLDVHVIPKAVAEELAGDKPFAIAFPKGSDLVPLFDQAIIEFEEEGFMDELSEKWLGQDYVDKLPAFYREN